ncbi:MAG: enoyl-CoA hydratase/isomerase family protein [Myxococcota bacterium]|jgi:enoyl-CoA hydratase/carnithine racemase
MSDQAVLYEVEDRVATITLNRPENRNSMTPDVLGGLSEAMGRAQEDPEVRCVIVTGTGKSFCAGADFKSGLPLGNNEEEGLYRAPQERTYRMYEHFLSILDVEVPTIAAMQGHAIGGGLGLAVVCDLRVANQDSRYGANFVKLGLHPGMATTYLLPRLMGVTRGIEFLLTGRIVSGAEAAEAGLVNYATPGDEVLARARELALEIAGAAPLAVKWTKRSIYQGLDWDPRRAARHEAGEQSRTFETQDSKEGVAALLERRAPDFKGE